MKNQERRKITRSRIMDEATRLFAGSGYNATGVSEICQAAGVSKGAFYHHFSSKNALFLALLDVWLQELDEGLNLITSQQLPFPEMLDMMSEMIEGIFVNYRHQVPILFEFWMQAIRDDQVWKAAIAPFQKYQDYFARLVRKGIEEGSLAAIEPQAGAAAVISMAIGLLLQGLLDARSVQVGQVSQQSIQILLNGLVRRDQ